MRLTPERLALLAGGFCLAVALVLGFIPAPDAVAYVEGGPQILDCGSVSFRSMTTMSASSVS